MTLPRGFRFSWQGILSLFGCSGGWGEFVRTDRRSQLECTTPGSGLGHAHSLSIGRKSTLRSAMPRCNHLGLETECFSIWSIRRILSSASRSTGAATGTVIACGSRSVFWCSPVSLRPIGTYPFSTRTALHRLRGPAAARRGRHHRLHLAGAQSLRDSRTVPCSGRSRGHGRHPRDHVPGRGQSRMWTRW